MQQLKDGEVLHSIFCAFIVAVVPTSCGDLRTGSSGLPRQSMYINDHSVRLENGNDKDASSKVMLSH
jgi:hypothetical protein